MSCRALWHALRRLRRQPAFAAGVIAVLAVAIGANTAIFTLVHAILLRPLPLRDPSRLVTFSIAKPGTDRQPLSLPDLEDFETESRTLEAIVAFFQWSVNVTGQGEAERLQGMRVSPEYFEVTGARVQLGRTIASSDEDEPVALITHGLWQRRFGGDAQVVGECLTLNGETFTIAGVLPPDFVSLVRDVDVVAPFSAARDPRRASRSQGFLRVIARMKPDVTHHQIQDDLDRISRRLRPPTRTPTAPIAASTSGLSTRRSAAVRPRGCACCSPPWGSCCWSRARTWRTCSSCEARRACGSLRCARHSGRPAHGSWPSWSWRQSCWRRSAECSACSWRGRSSAGSSQSAPNTCRGSRKSASTGAWRSSRWRCRWGRACSSA